MYNVLKSLVTESIAHVEGCQVTNFTSILYDSDSMLFKIFKFSETFQVFETWI